MQNARPVFRQRHREKKKKLLTVILYNYWPESHAHATLEPFPWQPSSLPGSALNQAQAYSSHSEDHSGSSGSTHAYTHSRTQTNPKQPSN